jgi:hypothetical protein
VLLSGALLLGTVLDCAALVEADETTVEGTIQGDNCAPVTDPATPTTCPILAGSGFSVEAFLAVDSGADCCGLSQCGRCLLRFVFHFDQPFAEPPAVSATGTDATCAAIDVSTSSATIRCDSPFGDFVPAHEISFQATGVPATALVSGKITYTDANLMALPVPDVSVTASGFGSVEATTDTTGDFTIPDLMPATWTITPHKTGGVGNAVSALDAAYVLQAVSELRDLSAVDRLACDVTGNGTVSTLDATRILQLKVGLIARLPAADTCDTDWLFIPNPAAAPDQTVHNPLTETIPCRVGSISFTPLDTAVVNQDFRAVVMGDCTGNWTPPAAAIRRIANNQRATVRIGRPRSVRGNHIRLPIAVRATAASAIELQLEVAAGLRLEHTRAIGLPPGSLLQTAQHGQRVLIAAAAPLATDRNPVIELTLSGAWHGASVNLVSAMVDDEAARLVRSRPN